MPPTMLFQQLSSGMARLAGPSRTLPTYPPLLAPVRPVRALHTSASRCQIPFNNMYLPSDRPSLSITKLNSLGFHLSDNVIVPGGLMIVEGRALLWNVQPPGDVSKGGIEAAWKGWTKDRFAVLDTVVPRPEMLVFGTGAQVIPPPREIKEYMSSLGIQLETMNSRNAASTYNLLSEEGRRVAVALCPPQPVDQRSAP